MPEPNEIPDGCRFHPRCPYAEPVCATTDPQPVELGADPSHTAACLAHTDAFDGTLSYEVTRDG
ncbi:MAG: hypothetical protein U5K37_02070 [Natrialbaceae archaeon]|nr:hypothetical protein [Natrialbaceae archaeon]